MGESGERWPLGRGMRVVHALACIAGFEALHLLAFGFAFGVLRLSPAELWTGNLVFIALSVVNGALGMGCLVWLGIVRFGRVPWRALGWHTDRLGPTLAAGALGLVLLLAALFGQLAAFGVLGELDVLVTLTSYTAAQRVLFLTIGLAAATVEESLFRGYLQPALIAKTGLVAGIVIGAVVFSLYHLFMGPSPFNLLGKLLFGLILGALRGRDRSLLAPVLAHFLFWQLLGSL